MAPPIMIPPRFRFLARYRLKKLADFQQVFKRRLSASDEFVIVYAAANGLAHPRLGLSVSRKVGNAVKRNRWKRLLREAFRLQFAKLPSGVDLVIVPRTEAEPNLKAIELSLVRLGGRAAKRALKV